MTPTDWATFAVAVTTLLGTLAMGVRHLVKHYLSELRPNGGSSLRDQVNRCLLYTSPSPRDRG